MTAVLFDRTQTRNTVLENFNNYAKDYGENFGTALEKAFGHSEARGVNALLSGAELLLEDELEDMYVVSEAHSSQLFLTNERKMSATQYDKLRAQLTDRSREYYTDGIHIEVPIGMNGLKEFIGDIIAGAVNGTPLEDVFEAQRNKFTTDLQRGNSDRFLIDPNTGSVDFTQKRPRNLDWSDAVTNLDRLTTYAMADDIATVLRYTYFKQEDDDPVKVAQLLAGIRSRSEKYNVDRYDPIYDSTVDHPNEWFAMRLKEEIQKGDAKEAALVDGLIELLDRHFKADRDRQIAAYTSPAGILKISDDTAELIEILQAV